MDFVHKKFMSYCPKLKTDVSLPIRYKIVVCGSDPNTYLIKCGFGCPHNPNRDCQFAGYEGDGCPVYQSAPAQFIQ